MTLLPSDVFGITGWPGNKYDVNEVCAHPECHTRSAHAHHMWPRSFIRKDYDWVRLPDGTILGNRVGLCEEHHRMVTGEIGGYRARLVWEGGIMWWVDRDVAATREQVANLPTVWSNVGPLKTQPPVAGRVDDVSEILVSEAHGHVDGAVCPVCGHHKHTQEPKAKLERRNTKQWTVTVPDDAEVGADILDGWIDDLAIPMGADQWSSRLKRYHVLCFALAWIIQNREEFIADLAEAAERRLAG